MQIHVCKHWRYLPALRRSLVAFFPPCPFHDSGFQKSCYIPQKILVCYIMLQKFHEPLLVQVIEKFLYVCFQHIVYFPGHDCLVYKSHYIMCASTWSESVGTVQKPLLVDVIQYPRHHALHQSVLIGRYSQRPHFPICFRNICPPHWLGYIFECFHPVH